MLLATRHICRSNQAFACCCGSARGLKTSTSWGRPELPRAPLSWAPGLRLVYSRTKARQISLYTFDNVWFSLENLWALSVIDNLALDNLALDKSNIDFYQVLAVPRHASSEDIKAAYHRALLTFHPDKQHSQLRYGSELATREAEVSIPLIREAYTTLSHPESRKRYDTTTLHGFGGKPGSRPAQVVSLEEFAVERPDPDGNPNSNGSEDQQDSWANEMYSYLCRCGGKYRLTTEDLENGHHLVGCECCSEVIWVGYEEIIEDRS